MKIIVNLIYHKSAALRLQHVPSIWEIAELIMFQKRGKKLTEPASFRPIFLFPIISKFFAKNS